jgi:two-component system, LytTR family, response regulator
VRSGRAIVPVSVASVSWFEALGDYVAAFVPSGGRDAPHRYLLHLSLQRLEARLDPSRFTRLHRARIVNLEHVLAFRRRGLSGLEAELRDGTRLAVSRARARELRALGV